MVELAFYGIVAISVMVAILCLTAQLTAVLDYAAGLNLVFYKFYSAQNIQTAENLMGFGVNQQFINFTMSQEGIFINGTGNPLIIKDMSGFGVT